MTMNKVGKRSLSPRILIVEDDPSIREAVAAALTGSGYLVEVRAHGVDLRETLAGFEPDLAVLDVRLPVGPDGLVLAQQLRMRDPDLPILMLTAADSVPDRVAGFDAGADDYLGKPFAVAELLARVKALLRRGGALRPPTRQVGDLVIDEERYTVHRAGAPVTLTAKEFALLNALAERPGKVYSKRQLLVTVWGFDGYDLNLVEVHMSSLRRKLEAGGRPRLVHTVRGRGYALREA